LSFNDIDRSILGREFDRVTFPARTADDLVAYAKLIGETDPIYFDAAAASEGPYGELVAQPTYVLGLHGTRMFPDEVMREVSRGGFDAGKDVELGVPVRPGDVLTLRSSMHDIYEKTGRTGSMYFIVIRHVVTNQRNETVAVMDQRMMQRGKS
jgi:acyl dehydratase